MSKTSLLGLFIAVGSIVQIQAQAVADSLELDELIVSATRWIQPARKTPSKISVIRPADVSLSNPQTAADLLGSTGEVFIQKSQQGGGSPMIRGFATNRLLYTVDGVRMNSAIFRAGNIQNVISIDANSVERTEILFGPGSIIYGSDAIGGVMSFQTLTPHFSTGKAVEVRAGAMTRYSSANQEATLHFHGGVGWKKWALKTSLTHSRFGDLRMGKHGPDDYLRPFYTERSDNSDHMIANPDPLVQTPTGYAQSNLMQKIRFAPSAAWDFQYGFHYSETTGYSRYDRLIETQTNGLPVSAVWNYGPQIWMMNNVSATHHSESKWFDHFTLRLAQQYFEESRIDRRWNHHRLRTQLEQVDAYSANLDFEKSTGSGKWVYGAEYIANRVKSTGSAIDIRNQTAMAVPDRYPQSLWSSYAGYLNYHYTASPALLIEGGIRYSGFGLSSDFSRHLQFYPFDFTTSSVKNSAATGSAGLVYTPGNSWKISLTAATAFRAPNVDDMGKIFDFADGEVIVPNTNLQAEYAYNTELSISKIFANRLKIDATAFYTYLDHAMVRRAFRVGNSDSILYNGKMSKVFAIQNAAYGTVAGFNAGFELKLPAGLSISARYNYQKGKEEMDNGTVTPSRHAAPAFGIARLSYAREKIKLQLYAAWSDEVSYRDLNEEERQKPALYARDQTGMPYSPAWYTLNFKASYQPVRQVTLSSGVENITDQRYRPYSSGLTAAGRNFIFSVKADF
jgi:hemoglobin/transferrin/lactoferrin receptor protein